MTADSPSTPFVALPPLFPFSAISGQPELVEALLLSAVDPALGGVLVEGPRGTAKSTAARGLAELLDGAPFVSLPLSASLEQLVGTLDLGAALGGHAVKFAPGLLARAHGGVLYVDEVNLLSDGLVDVLLDAAASGVNVVERDGISHAHAARFLLIGTMNAEEGELRPQLLDRFGLFVRLRNIVEALQRQAAVRARMAFDSDPEAFRIRHAQAQAALQSQLHAARSLVCDRAALPLDDAVHAMVGSLCIAAQVDGLRADLVMLRAARALAALEAAPAVTPEHVRRVAELVLPHRRGVQALADTPTSADGKPQTPAPGPHATAEAPQGAEDPGAPSQSAEASWGEMPAEAVGILRVKPLRPLLSTTEARAASKKA